MAPASKKPEAFHSPIPIDPLRLLYGIRRRWLFFAILPITLASIGWMLGSTKTENRYSVSMQLIKSEVPTTVQTSEAGQAFKPRQLSDDTLLSTTYSTEVLNRTASRLEPKRSPGAVKSMVEIAKQKNTSFFYLTAHSRMSAEDAIQTVTIWAEEIVRFTSNLQKDEARQMEAFISEQLDSIDDQLKKVNKQILEFARTNNFIDVDKQTETTLSALENTRVLLANTRIQLETKDVQIKRYREELRAQSPLEADLKRKREELTFLRGRYTDENPMVKEKLYEIEYINKQLEATSEVEIEDLKDFTGSDLGNNLYLEIIALQNERTELEKMVNNLSVRLKEQEKAVADLPEKALRLTELRNRRDLLLDAQALLDSRRKEAAFYETKAPGYWRIFQRPELNEVAHSSQNVKALLLTFMGFMGGFAIALLAAIASEAFHTNLATPFEAAVACCCLPTLNYITKRVDSRSWFSRHLFKAREWEHNARNLKSFWLTQAAQTEGQRRERILVVPTSEIEGETEFWEAVLNLLERDERKVHLLSVPTRKNDPLRELESHPAVASFSSSLDELEDKATELSLVRFDKDPGTNDIPILQEMEAYYLLNSPSLAVRSETQHQCELLRKLLGPADGLLLIDGEATNTLTRILRWLEITLAAFLANRTTKED